MSAGLWLALGVLLLLPHLALADGFVDESAAKAAVEKAMGMVAVDDIKGAIESFVPYWPIPRAEIDVAIATMVQQRKMIHGRYGKPMGAQFVEARTIAGTLLRVVYLEKYENAAIRWWFMFYKPAAKWRVNGISFDHKIELLFE
jgi:hypothetical protein